MWVFIKDNEIIWLSDNKDTISVYDQVIETEHDIISFVNGNIEYSDQWYYISKYIEPNTDTINTEFVDMYWVIMDHIYKNIWPVKDTEKAKIQAQKKARHIFDTERKDLFDKYESDKDQTPILSKISQNENTGSS